MIYLVMAFGRAAVRHPATVRFASWCGKLATRALARALNMPESLVLHTGAFAIAYVEAVERRATLVCPIRLWQDLKDRRTKRHDHASN